MPVTPYTPRHATLPMRSAEPGRTDDEIKAPGLAAMLRRSPHRVRQAAAAAIGAGLVLFVVTSVATAATHPAAKAPQAGAAAAAPPAATSAATTPAAPAPRHKQVAAPHQRVAAKDVTAKLVKSKRANHSAPATKQVISGLAANGIPNVALNAYRVAAARMTHDDPSCGIDWAMLAGIGREESDHGRFAGAVLNADGTSTPRIIGPALDGAHSDYIAAPANGYALDGDAKYTHALGPMQFIPQTWASYGVDANGDGKADIFNVNDAALGAARYLCAAGGNLRSQSGRVRAVLAYNHNDQYLAQVLALAQAYRSGLKVTGIPVGNLTGALPPIKAGSVLAVNPGIPTAVGLTGQPAKSHGKSHAGAPAKSGSSTGAKSGSKSGTKSGSKSGKKSGARKSHAPAPKSSAPKPGSGSSSSPGSSGGSGSGGGSGGSGGGSGGSPTPTPTPSPTCQIGIGGTCVVP
jgi:membrane-bound lytic murein transglycosylase B